MANRIRLLARRLYGVYLKPFIHRLPKPRSKIRYIAPPVPKYDVEDLENHALGGGTEVRILHLLAEGISMPAFALRRFLGTSRAMYKSVRKLEQAGIVRTIVRGRDLYVRLDRSWFAHRSLWSLLRVLNRQLSEYEAFAEINKNRRLLNEYTNKKRLRRGYGRYDRAAIVRGREAGLINIARTCKSSAMTIGTEKISRAATCSKSGITAQPTRRRRLSSVQCARATRSFRSGAIIFSAIPRQRRSQHFRVSARRYIEPTKTEPLSSAPMVQTPSSRRHCAEYFDAYLSKSVDRLRLRHF